MNRQYGWVVLAAMAAMLGGCELTDIGKPDDMTTRQREMRENRPIPKATEMPPGLGEDLPLPPTTRPESVNR